MWRATPMAQAYKGRANRASCRLKNVETLQMMRDIRMLPPDYDAAVRAASACICVGPSALRQASRGQALGLVCSLWD